MTTTPKPRRFRLRPGDPANPPANPSVAPQRGEARRFDALARDLRGIEPLGEAQAAPVAPVAPAAPAAPAAPLARASAAPVQEPHPAAAPAEPRPSPSPETAAPEPALEPLADDPGPDEGRANPGGGGKLTGRQLRMAMRVAQRNGIKASTGHEAVRLLRQRGIEPFQQTTILDMANEAEEAGGSRALARTEGPALPKARPEGQVPGPQVPGNRAEEVRRIQIEIGNRRRRRLALLLTRLAIFVWLPTAITAWYFYFVATPFYATNSEFVIQQADASASAALPGAASALLGGGGLTGQYDSVTVQSYLQSREAMRRLDAEHGFKTHFQSESIDPIRRLEVNASDEAAYRLYQRVVQLSYDPTEGLIRLEVIAADPETSERFARALVQYAEEQVDQLTFRMRSSQMREAEEAVVRAEQASRDAQMRVLDLQERHQVLSSDVEVSLLAQQITTLEAQLNQERLSLADLRSNPRPNAARTAQSERRIAALEDQIRGMRASLTQDSGGASLARIQSEILIAQSDVQTRQLMLASAMQQLETSRMEANRQVRYLSMGVNPYAPDEAAYPRSFANTLLAFLIFSGVYLMVSMTTSILREQVTS